jgi:hypothetical protein
VTRKQFLLILAAVIVLVGGGMGVAWWKRTSYERADARVGQRLVSGLTINDVAEVRIADARDTVTLVRGERRWTVKERGDFPEQKVVQTEGLSDAVKPRLQLAAPGSGAKPEETGVAVELKGRDGKSIAQLVLGKRTFKSSQAARPGSEGVATGRYVWVAAEPQRVNVISEPFSNVAAKPQSWLARDLMRVERIKSVTAVGPDGKEKWSMVKDTEAADWKWSGAGKLDTGKAQDAASALYGLQIADVAPNVSDSDAGLDKATLIRAQTFEGWTYELVIGKQAGKEGPEDRYYARSTVTGAAPESRTASNDEKPEDKEKADKAFADRKELLATKLEREKTLSGRVVLIAKSTLEPLLRERSALLVVEKPKDAAKK